MSQTYKTILVIAEKEEGEITSITFELLRAGRALADKIAGNLCAVVLGNGIDEVSLEIAQFSDEVFSLDHTLLETVQFDLYTSALEQLCNKINPDIILMAHNIDNLDLAPRLAYRMGTNLSTDCIALDIEKETEHLLCTKEIYGGNAIAVFEMEKKPYMATLRPKGMEALEPSPAKGKVVRFDPVLDESLTLTERVEIISEEDVSLDKADVIVAGGRGIGSIEGMNPLQELVKVLEQSFDKVELGASRPVIDAGWLPACHQIGLTGEKVKPELYIAIGISGAIQHLTGIFGSKKILAINNNPQAPIFKYSDYGVVGNYEDVILSFIKKIGELI